MRFVQDQVDPLFPPHYDGVSQRKLVGSDADVEGMGVRPALPLRSALLWGSIIRHGFEPRQEAFEFHFPIQKDARWNDDQMGSPNALGASEVAKESNRLYRFPEAHLVGTTYAMSVA